MPAVTEHLNKSSYPPILSNDHTTQNSALLRFYRNSRILLRSSDAAARVPHVVLVAAPDAAPVAVHAADVVSCGCCGCGGGGRKRRSLDNLRIRLEAKKSAEQSGAKLSIDEYPRQKRDIMCQNECASQPGCHFGHEHDIYGDY
ncbi:hypothetical protein GCK32_012329 [Trichostrongylus colubriformis]|uniref:Uncharacterized protein n=1 Tax=Trichostrongylus colubriformis TaxID=6319 RepID=A0AAN8G1Z7_TRICO